MNRRSQLFAFWLGLAWVGFGIGEVHASEAFWRSVPSACKDDSFNTRGIVNQLRYRVSWDSEFLKTVPKLISSETDSRIRICILEGMSGLDDLSPEIEEALTQIFLTEKNGAVIMAAGTAVYGRPVWPERWNQALLSRLNEDGPGVSVFVLRLYSSRQLIPEPVQEKMIQLAVTGTISEKNAIARLLRAVDLSEARWESVVFELLNPDLDSNVVEQTLESLANTSTWPASWRKEVYRKLTRSHVEGALNAGTALRGLEVSEEDYFHVALHMLLRGKTYQRRGVLRSLFGRPDRTRTLMPMVLGRLSDPDPDVQAEAIEALMSVRDQVSESDLARIRALRSSPHVPLRRTVIRFEAMSPETTSPSGINATAHTILCLQMSANIEKWSWKGSGVFPIYGVPYRIMSALLLAKAEPYCGVKSSERPTTQAIVDVLMGRVPEKGESSYPGVSALVRTFGNLRVDLDRIMEDTFGRSVDVDQTYGRVFFLQLATYLDQQRLLTVEDRLNLGKQVAWISALLTDTAIRSVEQGFARTGAGGSNVQTFALSMLFEVLSDPGIEEISRQAGSAQEFLRYRRGVEALFHLIESRIRLRMNGPKDFKSYLFQYGSVDPVFPPPSPGSAEEQEAAARTYLMWRGIDRLAEQVSGARISPDVIEHSRKRMLRYVDSLAEALISNDDYHDQQDAGTGSHYLYPNAYQFMRYESGEAFYPILRGLFTTMDWYQGRFIGFRYLKSQNNGVFEHNLLGNLSLVEALDRLSD